MPCARIPQSVTHAHWILEIRMNKHVETTQFAGYMGNFSLGRMSSSKVPGWNYFTWHIPGIS